MQRFLTANKLISPNQWGAQPGRLCYQAIRTVANTIEEANAHGKPLYAAFIDLRKFFDSIPYSTIQKALRHHHFPESVVSIIGDCLNETQMDVVTDFGITEPFTPTMRIIPSNGAFESFLRQSTDTVRIVVFSAKSESPTLLVCDCWRVYLVCNDFVVGILGTLLCQEDIGMRSRIRASSVERRLLSRTALVLSWLFTN